MSAATEREENEMELRPDDIRRVLEALDASDWDEAVITVGDVRIAVARNGASLPGSNGSGQVSVPAEAPAVPVASEVPPATQAAPAPPAPTAPETASPPPAAMRDVSGRTQVVTAPSVGVFWRSPEPGAPPFAEVGQRVEAGATLGIVEVMKLMSHVDAPVAGRVVEIHVENAASVEHGDPLFTLALEEA
jgi:acetyl-CoA carboxylase biotin carboxyl carrier protein